MCGFGNALAFKTINDADIDFVENRIKETRMQDRIDNKNLIDIFGKNFAGIPSQFQFMRGERKQIKELVRHVQNEVNRGGINCGIHRFKPPSEKEEVKQRCPICSAEKK